MALGVGDIPLDAIPGFQKGMSTANALSQQSLENRIKQIEAQYAPLTKSSEAASKFTYANLMGPQFMAKLFGNPNILPNVEENQKGDILQQLLAAGGNTRNISNPIFNIPQTNTNPLNFIVDKIRNLFSHQNVPLQNNFSSTGNIVNQPSTGVVNQSPVEQSTMPNVPSSITTNVPTISNNKPTFAENRGKYEGIVEEGKEAGKIRSNDIKDLNDIGFNAHTTQTTLDELNNIVNSNTFREIRQIPLAGQHEIGWYAQFGTPEQKRLIGNFLAEQGQVVVNAASQFKGAFRVGEQALINTMKVNPSDLPDVAVGKIQAMSLMNNLLGARSQLTAKLMEDNHISKGKAMDLADKQIDSNAIKKQIESQIKVTIRNKKTGEKKTVSLNEAKKLGVPNV